MKTGLYRRKKRRIRNHCPVIVKRKLSHLKRRYISKALDERIAHTQSKYCPQKYKRRQEKIWIQFLHIYFLPCSRISRPDIIAPLLLRARSLLLSEQALQAFQEASLKEAHPELWFPLQYPQHQKAPSPHQKAAHVKPPEES